MHAVGTRARADLYRATFDELLISLRRPPVIDRERIERPDADVFVTECNSAFSLFQFIVVAGLSDDRCTDARRSSVNFRIARISPPPCAAKPFPLPAVAFPFRSRRFRTGVKTFFGATGATLHNAHVQKFILRYS